MSTVEEKMEHLATGDPSRTPECPGGLTLMLLHTGDLPGEEQTEVWRHARGCDHCRGVLDGLEGAREQVLAEEPFDQAYPRMVARAAELPSRDPAVHEDGPTSAALRRGLRRWLAAARDPRAWAAVAVATAVLALTLVLTRDAAPPAPAPGPGGDGISAVNRAKGQVALDLFALQAGLVTEIEPGEALRPGDRIQFTYTSAGLDHLVVLGADGSGVLTRYYPDEGRGSQPVAPGTRMVLEDSIVLDEAPGPEVYVAVFSDGPLAVDAVERAVLEALAEGDGEPGALLGLTSLEAIDGALATTWVAKDLGEGD